MSISAFTMLIKSSISLLGAFNFSKNHIEAYEPSIPIADLSCLVMTYNDARSLDPNTNASTYSQQIEDLRNGELRPEYGLTDNHKIYPTDNGGVQLIAPDGDCVKLAPLQLG